jgi:hypothetical protein
LRSPPISGIPYPWRLPYRIPQKKALDAWIATQREPRPTRPEAIRRILADALQRPVDAGSIAAEDLNASNDE